MEDTTGTNRGGGSWRAALAAAALLAATGLACCAGRGYAFPTADVVAPAGSDDLAREQLRRGRVIAITGCTGCHRALAPGQYPPARWPGIVRDMGARAGLSSDDVRDLAAYFVAASRAVEAPAAPPAN
jgi:hypothetical protein